MADTTAQMIAGFVQENFIFDDSPLDLTASFLDSGLIDSTGVLELILFVEETFAIVVEDDEVLPENFDSIEMIAAYVGHKLDDRRIGLPVTG
jgi:acyl carrier protein